MVVASAYLSGCQSPTFDGPLPPKQVVIGKSVEGRPIACEIFGKSGNGSHTILILASIHGNEHVGTPLVQRLSEYLREHPETVAERRILLVAEANPDGAFYHQRHNARGIDLNRNFPAKNWNAQTDHGAKPLSEPESRALHGLIAKYKPSRIVSLHQPLECMDFDGPGQALADAMSATCDLKVNKVGALDGSLGSYAGEKLGIPIVTVEFDATVSALPTAELWNRYGNTLITAIRFPFPTNSSSPTH
ncbi:MAG: murein peptide amidase [Verrucomicrobiales bacterium]|nr:murein peptide amidase [Verrucomicrobiales bacterium]